MVLDAHQCRVERLHGQSPRPLLLGAFSLNAKNGLPSAISPSVRPVSQRADCRVFVPRLDKHTARFGCVLQGGYMSTMDINFTQPSPTKNLTQREIEVLKWSAEGKTAGDIAMILCLKERTIHFHIASAIQKMGVCNKTAAAVQAALSGMF
ncbi:Regulatory protein, LuxR [Pseudomonas syringae pv. spinaceae]|nr:Regulatory protein, LuxR [Pseudomonas syringae pv. spinaceae]